MQTLGGAVPPAHPMAGCEFSTLRSRFLKVAVLVRETATRVRLAFAANCPDAALFRDMVLRMIPGFRVSRGRRRPSSTVSVNLSRLPDTLRNAVKPAGGKYCPRPATYQLLQ